MKDLIKIIDEGAIIKTIVEETGFGSVMISNGAHAQVYFPIGAIPFVKEALTKIEQSQSL